MESRSVCNHTSDLIKSNDREAEFDLLSKTTDRNGQHKLPLAINHKCYNFRGSQKGQKAGERGKLF